MKKKMGYLMIIVGAMLFIGVQVGTLTTLTVDTTPPLIYLYAPSGTRTSPTPLTRGEYVDGIKLWATDALSALSGAPTVHIIDDATGTVISSFHLPYTGHTSLINGYIWGKYEKYDYLLPTSVSSCALIKFEFEVADEKGNVAYARGFGLTGTPDGYFEINGQKVLSDTHLTLATREINIHFTATKAPDEIAFVEVEITRDANMWTVNMIPVGTSEWAGDWTAPSDGVYTIDGYIAPTYDTTVRYKKLSVVMDTGFGELPPLPFSDIELFSFGLMGVGCIVTLKTRKSQGKT